MYKFLFLFTLTILMNGLNAQSRVVSVFNKDWRFFAGDEPSVNEPGFNDAGWRALNLPHDWSIEGPFSESNPATTGGGALPTGIGWYRKAFFLPADSKDKKIYIQFDGIYRNSEVWINGHYLGKRPNGYISFRYELTPWLNFGEAKNVIAVKVDNSAQPASRWYSGSGIYRNSFLITTNPIAFDQYGVFITTPVISKEKAGVHVETTVLNSGAKDEKIDVEALIYNEHGKLVAQKIIGHTALQDSITKVSGDLVVFLPKLWSVQEPYLYKVVTKILRNNKLVDRVETTLGIRDFRFDPKTGFYLNGKPLKILGVCNHHDLGALGAAINTRAMERQLEILKAMGCNAIRTAHNPPAPGLLDLCDRMGFLVMDEAFDMWRKKKNNQDYHLDFDNWSRRDLGDMVKRDRNHPSVFVWSIGNEIREQFDSSGIEITKDLVATVKSLDSTRPVTSALTENFPEKNFIYQSGALDILGFNYKLADYPQLPKRFPGYAFLATETSSALASRGHYDLPSDSIRLWPPDGKTPVVKGNPDFTVSAYDNVHAYWGSTHEEGWKAVKKYDFMSGIFVWSGFDFLGEPVPYPWPARSSYYGLVDLAGFPKDSYYLYQSEWATKPVLHLFPHWNWQKGQVVDLWAYYSQADEVELFLNERSLGVKKKKGDEMHVMWRVNYVPGTLKAVSRLNGKIVLTQSITTAGKPASIELLADRKVLWADGEDLCFVTVRILDANGNLVPGAENLIQFAASGEGTVEAADNGDPASTESFRSAERKAYKGLALVIVRPTEKNGTIQLEARGDGLSPARLTIRTVSPGR